MKAELELRQLRVFAAVASAGTHTRAARALGLSQSDVGEPLSRAFLSSVESGRVVPSLPSLLMIARRLNTSAAAILAAVDRQLEAEANGDHANRANQPAFSRPS